MLLKGQLGFIRWYLGGILGQIKQIYEHIHHFCDTYMHAMPRSQDEVDSKYSQLCPHHKEILAFLTVLCGNLVFSKNVDLH